MAVRIPPNIIMMLIETIIIIGVIVLFFAPAIFGGPEITAARNIAEMLEGACAKPKNSGSTTTFNEVLPDSKGVNPPDFLFISIEQQNLILVARRGSNDLGTMFQDFVSCVCAKSKNYLKSQVLKGIIEYALRCECKERTRVLKIIPLENCKKNDIQLCGYAEDGSGERCDSFQFESHEGQESLTFTVEKIRNADKVKLSYSRATICGDGRCCAPEQGDSSKPDYCSVDCPEDGTGECKILTTAVEEAT